MLTMCHSEPSRSGLFSEVASQHSNEDDLYSQFTCPFHLGFKLQVLCPKDNFNPPLLCIKCMIDPEIERQIKNEQLIAIHDVINKASTAPSSEAYNQRNTILLKDKIVEFSEKDYLGSYQRHTDAQMKKLQQEIDRVKDSLGELQNQFKVLFDKQYKDLKQREEDLKKKIIEYVEEQERMEDFAYSSHESIMETIRKTSSVKEYTKIIKALYYRGTPNQRATGGSSLNQIFDTMDELKQKINKMKNSKIQTSMLEEIRKKIDSIEILDQSMTLEGNLNPRLMQTLEKIRQIEEKKKTPQKEPVQQKEPAQQKQPIRQKEPMQQKETMQQMMTERLPQRKADPLIGLKERLANFGKKSAHSKKQMEIETASISDPFTKTHKVDDRKTSRLPYEKQNAVKTDEKKQTESSDEKRGKESTTHMFNMAHAGMNASHNVDYHRMDDEDRTHRRQQVDDDSYRRVSEQKNKVPTTQMFNMAHAGTNASQDADYHRMDDEDRMHRRQKVDDDSYRRVSEQKNKVPEQKNKAPERTHQDYDPNRKEFDFSTEYPIRDEYMNEYLAYPQLQSQPTGSKTYHSSTKTKIMVSEFNQKSSNKFSDGKQNYSSQSKKDNSLDTWFKPEKEKSRENTKEKIEKKKQRAEPEDEEGNPPTKKRRATVKGLHDWINRRVTGYLVFQNTMQDGGLEREHEGDHLNRIAGEKWKGLSNSEKEEYKSLAIKARMHLKREFRDVEKDDPHIKELQEIIEKKLKKIKND